MASRRKTTRQQSSTANGTEGQSGGDGGPNRELLQQYSEGKKFKVKYLGSHDIEDYRNKRETSTIMSDLKKRSSKAPKPKAIISLYSKELVVMDEKSKTVTMKVPLSKVKFVCHNKTDTSLFGVILATDRITSNSQRLHRMFCYQTDPKIAATFVRSVNELFQLLAAIMRERRSRAEANNRAGDSSAGGGASATGGGVSATGGGATSGGGGASGGRTNQSQGGSDRQQQVAGATGGDPMSDDERYEPVPLGFGIEAPPPSYKAAISKKNEALFKKPDDIQTTVKTHLPPPPSARVKKPAPPPPAARLSAPPTSHSRRTAAQQPPIPASTATPQQATPTARTATPTSATSLPLPQVPVTSASSSSGGATFNVGATDEEDTRFDLNAGGNIYDVPMNNQLAPPSQEQRQAVWQEWQALESELQTIAQDLGFDMDSNNSNGGVGASTAAAAFPSIEEMNIPPPSITSDTSFNVNQSFSSSMSEDPFADDFFQTSFTSPTASLNTGAAWPGPNDVAVDQMEDPFDSSAGFEAAWGTSQTASQATGVSSSNNADPFQESLATPTGSSGNQAAATSDPFLDSATPTSASASFDLASFSAQLPWSESASVTTTIASTTTQAVPTASFDEGFGSDWGAFGDNNMSTTASNTAALQAPKKQDSQPEPAAVLGPPPQVTTPRRAEAVQTPATTAASSVTTSEDSFGPSPAAVPPPPLPKRDSGILMPPPVSPSRRADTISDRNQSTSSRSRPRPSADQAPATSAKVVLNRPVKSKSSPSQTRANSGEIEAQQQVNLPHIPTPDFGAEVNVATTNFDAMFEAANSDTQGSGGMPMTSMVTSDPFQSSPPMATLPSSEASASGPFQTGQPATPTTSQVTTSDSFQDSPLLTSQATNINDLFQDSLPPASTVSTSLAAFSDPFQDGSPQTSIASSQLSGGNPFQDVSPLASVSSAQQPAPSSDPFQDSFPQATVSASMTTSGGNDPFQSGIPPPTSAQSRKSTASQAKTIKSPPASTSDGGGDNWSDFGDMWSSKKQETSASSDWSGFGSTGNTDTTFKSNDGWPAFDSQPQQQEQQKQPTSSGFGDNWSGFPDGGKSTTSTPQNQPASASNLIEPNTSVATAVSQNKTESPWDAFGQGSISMPSSSVQSQPQVQQKPAKSAAAGLLLPPSKSSRASGGSGSLATSQSRPRARPSGDRASGSRRIVNPPSSQKAQSSSGRAGQAQAGSVSKATAVESMSNPLNKSEVSTKKSGSYLDDLSSLSSGPSQQQHPQFPPMNMNYPGAAGGPPFQQQQPGGWGSPPGPSQSPPFSQQPMQTPPQQPKQPFPYGGPQPGAGGGGPGIPLQQQQQQQQQQFMQQQQRQAMFTQQQQAMQQGPPGSMPQGPPGSMQQQGPPGSMQRGPPGSMQQIPPGSMQQGPPGSMQQGPPGSMPQGSMQQGPPGLMPQGSMQRGPPGSMQQLPPGSMQQGPPGSMQQGPSGLMPQGSMQQGPPGSMPQGPPGSMQRGYNVQQMPPGQMPMQQDPMGFLPGGPQMMGPPGGGQMQQAGPSRFSTPQQQQNFYQQQQLLQQQQQNPNAFSPIGQPNPLTPGNASMGGQQFSVTGGSNLSTSHLYTSDFSSPPYAVGSSTPQSGAPSMSASPPPPPATVEYRPNVSDGRPDPFAALVTGALTPTKDGKVKGVDAQKLKAAFIKQPSPNRFPSPGPTYYGNVSNNNNNSQGGWV